MRHEQRAPDDGYGSGLVSGLRASADAERLARELALASGRLLLLAADPPPYYARARELAASDLPRATWACVLAACVPPRGEEQEPAAAEAILASWSGPGAPASAALDAAMVAAALAGAGSGDGVDAVGVARTLAGLLERVERAAPDGGADAWRAAFTGDASWTGERRFGRTFERLAVAGFTRAARYELLVVLGRLGIYELAPDALQFGAGPTEPATMAAKRVFGIADPMLLERRASALAEGAEVPLEALDLALCNWISPVRETRGFPPDTLDEAALGRAAAALGV